MRLHVCRQPTYRQPAYSEVLQPSDSDETWESDRTWSSYEDNGDDEDTDEGEDEDENEDQLCSALAPEPAGRARRPRSKKQPAWAPEPAAWASNLTDEEAAEWMIDCYRLRLDDDLLCLDGDYSSSDLLRGLYKAQVPRHFQKRLKFVHICDNKKI